MYNCNRIRTCNSKPEYYKNAKKHNHKFGYEIVRYSNLFFSYNATFSQKRLRTLSHIFEFTKHSKMICTLLIIHNKYRLQL